MMLGAVLPEMRAAGRGARHDLSELVSVRKQIAAERDRLQTRGRVARRGAHAHDARWSPSGRSSRPSAKRRSTPSATRAAELAQPGGQSQRFDRQARSRASTRRRGLRARPARSDSRPALAALHDPGRLAPAVAFASAARTCPIPVNGVKFKEFGAPDGLGGSEKGVSIATRAGAQVTAPCRWLGGLCRAVPLLRPTLDPECRRRVSCIARWDGSDISRSRPVRADRRTRCGDGERLPYRRHPRDRFQPAGAIRRVPKGRDSRRSRPMVGG